MSVSFLSTLSLRRATSCAANCQQRSHQISIHALLAESDVTRVASTPTTVISIHALLAESDLRHNADCNCRSISIHALLAESDIPALPHGIQNAFISIHALLAESDSILCTSVKNMNNFYPRSPCGERLLRHQKQDGVFGISIHALLAESDPGLLTPLLGRRYFYPRSPCGERPPRLSRVVPTPIFLSTLSLRRATHTSRSVAPLQGISIHALLAESDRRKYKNSSSFSYFYPRSPCGERHYFCGAAL